MARQKLVTKAIEKALPKLGSTESIPCGEKKCIVKFFSPVGAATWWAVEGEREADGDIRFFGMVTLWGDFAEWGYFTLQELKDVHVGFGLGIERDMYYSDDEFKRDLKRFGY